MGNEPVPNLLKRFSLQLDMKKVAKVDDTFVVQEAEFEDDTRSADSYKERILNTNLIINRTSFKSQRPSECDDNLDDEMAELPLEFKNRLDNNDSSSSHNSIGVLNDINIVNPLQFINHN